MGDEEAKRIIFARRARFVAAAVAGLNLAMCGGKSEDNPQPCLSVINEPADSGNPQPCLSQVRDPVDAAADAADADAEPQPCLSPPPPDGGDAG